MGPGKEARMVKHLKDGKHFTCRAGPRPRFTGHAAGRTVSLKDRIKRGLATMLNHGTAGASSRQRDSGDNSDSAGETGSLEKKK